MSTDTTVDALPAAVRSPTDAAGGALNPRHVMAFIAMCFGMFMAFLDIQIVSA
jgi:DHA2 family multidrug resistance protein